MHIKMSELLSEKKNALQRGTKIYWSKDQNDKYKICNINLANNNITAPNFQKGRTRVFFDWIWYCIIIGFDFELWNILVLGQ